MGSNNTRKLGRYELLTRIAKGGMAEIHLARQRGIEGFERLVVLKLIHPHFADEDRFVEMFLDEARIAARLNHPNVVQIYDFGKDGDEYFIAMEYLEGESLGIIVKAGLESGTPLEQHLAAGIIAQVCDGLDYAHKFVDIDGKFMKIVHRDVSPQNIIVLYSGMVKLVDFGIAKAASKIHKTRSGTLKGKLTYMSPEQCKALAVDPRTDVFSLGAVFWEMITSRRLFKRESEAAMIDAIVNEPIPNPREIKHGLMGEYADIAMTALQRDPRKRFQSAGAMATAIRAVLHQSNQHADASQIGKYIRSVLGGRQKAKQELLRELVKADGNPVEFKVLKPDTEESIPHDLDTGSMTNSATESMAVAPLQQQPSALDTKTPPSNIGLWRVIGITAAGVSSVFFLVLFVVFGFGDEKPSASRKSPAALDRVFDAGVGKPSPDTQGTIALLDAGTKESSKDSQSKTLPLGSLDIVSSPSGCRVQVDGIDLSSRTPIEHFEITPGIAHEVNLLCRGYHVDKRQLRVESGKHQTLTFKPRPLVNYGKDAKKGYLRLDTTPWSMIYLGKKKLGMTPLVDMELPAGVHFLTAINKQKGLRKKIKVRIRPGKSTSLQVAF